MKCEMQPIAKDEGLRHSISPLKCIILPMEKDYWETFWCIIRWGTQTWTRIPFVGNHKWPN